MKNEIIYKKLKLKTAITQHEHANKNEYLAEKPVSKKILSKQLIKEEMRVKLDTLQPVFVVGTSKSGTSFLLSLFDSHLNTITLFETNVYYFPKRKFNDQNELVAAVYKYFTPKFRNFIRCGKNVALNNFLAEVKQSISFDNLRSINKSLLYAFLSVVLDGIDKNSAQQITHFVEKTPRHYARVDKIIADFPNAKIIHVLRDPRDNYLSLKRRMRDQTNYFYNKLDYHPINFIRKELLESFEAAYENVYRYSEQYRILFYEDLIIHQKSIMSEITSWLDLAWQESLVIPSVDGELWKGNSTVPNLHNQLKPFDTRPIGRWKAKLSGREIGLMEHIIKCYSLQLKYPLIYNLSRMNLAFGLMLPFQEEIKSEFNRMRKVNSLPKLVAKILWFYVKKRILIYIRLQRQRFNSDNRLTEGSFTPKKVNKTLYRL